LAYKTRLCLETNKNGKKGAVPLEGQKESPYNNFDDKLGNGTHEELIHELSFLQPKQKREA